MKDLISHLQEKVFIAEHEAKLLNYNFSSVAKELFCNQMENAAQSSKHGHRYTPEVKQFAMTLNYDSPKAYNFV